MSEPEKAPSAGSTLTVDLTRRDGYAFSADFGAGLSPLLLDEGPPLGHGLGPKPTQTLAAAIGHCLSASLVMCLTKSRIEIRSMHTSSSATTSRNEEGRLRISAIAVRIDLDVPAENRERVAKCVGIFEEYCTVTASVRKGIPVAVAVVDVDGKAFVQRPPG